MKTKVHHIIYKLHPKHVSALLDTFLKDESIGGKLILGAAVLSLIVVNSPLQGNYADFWQTRVSLSLGDLLLSLDLRHWVNEALMAFFFLVVGLEIKRELVKGELREFRKAILPIGAAVGGMLIPALIYLFFNAQTEAVRGWGIPIATDVAFAVAILALLGRRVPVSLKIFLLTLAIADDIGAIIVIALFYAKIIHVGFLLASMAIVLAIFVFRKLLVDRLLIVMLAGVTLWLTTHFSGIHASIVGAIMGLLAPISTRKGALSTGERVEKSLLPFTTFVVLPVFAFANAGFVLSGDAFSSDFAVAWGIILGLALGKAIGITLSSWLLVKMGLASLPLHITWRQVVGVGFIAGVGFTVSIFITELAFVDSQHLIDTAKVSICIASIISALVGIALLAPNRKNDSSEV